MRIIRMQILTRVTTLIRFFLQTNLAYKKCSKKILVMDFFDERISDKKIVYGKD